MSNEDTFARMFTVAEGFMMLKGECQPTFVFETGDTPVVMPLGWRNDEERTWAKRLVGIMAIAFNAHAIVMVSESWLAVRKGDDDRPDLMPRDDPDRKEVIAVAIAARGDDGTVSVVSQARAIIREAGGEFSALQAMSAGVEAELTESWLGKCVPRKPVDRHSREIAMELLRLSGLHMERQDMPTQH